MSALPGDVLASLLDAAASALERAPDQARLWIAEAVRVAERAQADAAYGRACELLGRAALATGDADAACAPLAAAVEDYLRRQETLDAARAAAALRFARAPAPFESDAELLAAEVAFAEQWVESHLAEADLAEAGVARDALAALTAERIVLDLRRAWAPLPGSDRAVERVARGLGLDTPTASALLLGVSRLLSPRVAASLSASPSAWVRALAPVVDRPIQGEALARATANGSRVDAHLLAHLRGESPLSPRGRDLSWAPLQATTPGPDLAEQWPSLTLHLAFGGRLVLLGPITQGTALAAALAGDLNRRLLVHTRAASTADRDSADEVYALADAAFEATLHDTVLAVIEPETLQDPEALVDALPGRATVVIAAQLGAPWPESDDAYVILLAPEDRD